ncbi:IQ domain-containing protein E isoform X2 [Microcaecilia unicolor]|uniref:IQ domain-containing protein E isoform X2 n=1 Tax=Microcaecilia unicolor TaxID=1415580 RepID=A0A6P7YQ87_9AMPH|nr:IQ domain-containing protein E isoform X2 [Microcaecilia unicolor]
MSWAASESGTEIEELEELGDDTLSAITYESDTDKKQKKKTSHKPPRSPKSPYLSSPRLHPKKSAVWRSLKGTGNMHTENPMIKVPRQLWLASLRQGIGLTQPLKSDMDVGHAWMNSSSNTPEYLKEALGMKKPKYSRSSSNGYIPGTPDYKEKEDMYDEIIDLKKTLQAQKSETDVMKTKLRRLEEENNRKDRQIEQLLDPSRSLDFTRSLADRKSDTSLAMNVLKQKILKLEQQCKEKDSALSKLQTDLRTTSVEEMKIAMETYYEEIQRLQILLANAEAMEKRAPPASKGFQKHQKVLKATILRLTKSIKELQDENQSLKLDLDRALSVSPTSSRAKGYGDWNKQRLVRRISELEKKVDELENSRLKSSDLDHARTAQLSLPSQVSEQSVPLSPPRPDPHEQCERLQTLVKKLKGDRSALQNLLGSKDSEIKKLKKEMDLEKELQKMQETKTEKSKEEIQRLKQKVKKLEAELAKERQINEAQKEPHSPQVSQQDSADCVNSVLSRLLSDSANESKEDQRRHEAAELIQSHWRKYKHKREEGHLDEVAAVLQAAFRGHLARQKLLSSNICGPRSPSMPRLSDRDPHTSRSDSLSSPISDTNSEEEAITILQSVFRAHLARTNQHQCSLSVCSPGDEQKPAKNYSPKKTLSQSPGKPPAFIYSSSDEKDSAEMGTGEGGEKWRKLVEHSPSPRQPSSAHFYEKQYQSTSTPPANEVPSDDSDEIIVVPPSRPARKRDIVFWNE